jgi:hypothetical protein
MGDPPRLKPDTESMPKIWARWARMPDDALVPASQVKKDVVDLFAHLAHAQEAVRQRDEARRILGELRDFLIMAEVMIPSGQPEYRQCREWVDRLKPFDLLAAHMARDLGRDRAPAPPERPPT